MRPGSCRLLLAAAALMAALMAPTASPQDTVSYSFVYLGCNRLQQSDWKPMQATNPSSANVPQLQQTLADLAGPFYGFTLVKLYVSGQVSVTSYQRPVPNPYFAADPLPPPARPQPEMFLPR